jgi:hypothetical protein
MLATLAATFAMFQGGVGAWGIAEWIIAIIAIAGAVGILIIVLRVMDISIPDWAWKIFWIVVLVAVAIFAVRLIFSM